MAMFPAEAAARYARATLREAVDHVPVSLLYKSTALDISNELSGVVPPAKTAKLPEDVAARPKRATVRCDVDHVPCARATFKVALIIVAAAAAGSSQRNFKNSQNTAPGARVRAR